MKKFDWGMVLLLVLIAGGAWYYYQAMHRGATALVCENNSWVMAPANQDSYRSSFDALARASSPEEAKIVLYTIVYEARSHRADQIVVAKALLRPENRDTSTVNIGSDDGCASAGAVLLQQEIETAAKGSDAVVVEDSNGKFIRITTPDERSFDIYLYN